MKKLITLSAAAVMAIAFFASCKKEYTCVCTINGEPTEFQLGKLRKPDAKLACEVYNVSGVTDCKLK